MTDLPAALIPHDEARYGAAVPVFLMPPGGDFGEVARRARFEGGLGQTLVLADRVLVGAGDGTEPLALGAAAATLGEGDYRLEGSADHLALLAWALGAYRYDRYKQAPTGPRLILPQDAEVERLAREAAATTLVRDLINTPTEEMGPADLRNAAERLAETHGADLAVTEGDALREGFPLVHAVGRAAATPPQLLDLRWGEEGPRVTLVGKGVCFDTGGLNIKTGKGMGLMKKDMGGGATVLGLASLIMAAGLKLRLRVLVPAVENAIAGNAFRPGDVFRSRDGQTVEISNTDAEGRLILADALAYAAEEAPDRIISFATLTGAARVALGPDLPPIYATDEDFAHDVRRAGDRVADPVWPMPFWSRYAEYLKSSIADVNHAADTPFAGSITAALFLRRFVGAVPYAHLDIYGWVPSARPGRPMGGEALGMRAVYEVLAADCA